MAVKINYKGPDRGSLPANIAEKVLNQLPEPVEGCAALELHKGTLTGKPDDFGPRDYGVIFSSDNRGLVQSIFYEGDEFFNIRKKSTSLRNQRFLMTVKDL